MDIEERRKLCWSGILEEKIIIPAEEIKVYDKDGACTGRIHYCDGTSAFIPLTSAPASADISTEGGAGLREDGADTRSQRI